MSAVDESHPIVLLRPAGRSPEPDGSIVAAHDDGSETRRSALLQGPFGALQQLTPQPAMPMTRSDDQPIDRPTPPVPPGAHRAHDDAVVDGDEKRLGVSIH